MTGTEVLIWKDGMSLVGQKEPSGTYRGHV